MIFNTKTIFCLVCLSVSVSGYSQKIVNVKLAGQAGNATIQGQVKGRDFIDYAVNARAGQTISIRLSALNSQSYFNLLPPTGDAAMFIGSTSGNSVKRILPDDGKFRIRVYLMTAAARRNESSKFTLAVSLSGRVLAPLSGKSDALVPGTRFHATSNVKCKLDLDKSITQCDASVVRRSHDGTATMVLKLSGGQTRAVLFVKGKPIASDSTEKMSYESKGDLIIVSFGTSERFEINEALIVGG